MIPIRTLLDEEDAQNLFDVLNAEIISNNSIAKLKFLTGEITQDQHDWYIDYSQYLKKIYKKLWGQDYK